MSKESNILSTIRENKTLFIILAVGLFLIELEIFALAAMKSGRHSRLQVLDRKGNVIHETDGAHLSDFNKYYFEKTFGPFKDYEVRLQTREDPFPFRAWFVAAIGIPVGVILLFGFMVRAYIALFYGDRPIAADPENEKTAPGSRLEKVVARFSRFNIFTIGVLVFLAVFAYWVVPNLITYIGTVGIETLTRYRWVALGIALVFLGFAGWIVYLRYLLAKRTIDAQAGVEQYRLRLEYEQRKTRPLLAYDEKKAAENPLVSWPEEKPAGQEESNFS